MTCPLIVACTKGFGFEAIFVLVASLMLLASCEVRFAYVRDCPS